MDILALAERVLESQPFSRFVGAHIGAATERSAELVLPIRPELTQQHGFVHGGVISYLADNTLTFAGGIALGGDGVTAEYKINYLRPATGRRLIARAEVLQVGKTQAVCRCDVLVERDGREVLVAVAQGTINRVGGGESH